MGNLDLAARAQLERANAAVRAHLHADPSNFDDIGCAGGDLQGKAVVGMTMAGARGCCTDAAHDPRPRCSSDEGNPTIGIGAGDSKRAVKNDRTKFPAIQYDYLTISGLLAQSIIQCRARRRYRASARASARVIASTRIDIRRCSEGCGCE